MSQPPPLSEDLRAAALAERAIVESRIGDLREQSRRLLGLAAAIDGHLASSIRLLSELDEMLGVAPQMSMTHADEVLRGQRLREVAIQILKGHKGKTVHYREWYDLVVLDGHRVSGQDPIATFLTEVSRAAEIEPVGRRSGLYRLRAA